MDTTTTSPWQTYLVALGTGVLFAVGLAFGGMTLPSKVIGFFDFSRGLDSWDPSLAFVMMGGMAVYIPAFALSRKRSRPLWEERFRLPTRRDIDRSLIFGAMLFGAGWGLGGFCPGPAFTSVGALSKEALVSASGMLAGMFIHQLWGKMKARQRERAINLAKGTTP